MVDVECPGCGRFTSLPDVDQSHDEFCEHCDAPLFFGRPWSDGDAAAEEETAGGVGRRPGFEGRRILVGETCPVCHEPNRAEATYCRRCGADMRPVVAASSPPPPPEATPAPPQSEWVATSPIAAPRSRDWLITIVLQVALLFLLVATALTVLVVRTLD